MHLMNLQYHKIIWADKIVGIPICFFFTLWSRLKKSLSHRPTKSEQFGKILFIQLTEIGSAILSYSAIKRINEAYPKAEIYLLTLSENKEIQCFFDNIIPEERVLTVNIESWSKFIVSFAKLAFLFCKTKIELVFDFELFTRIGSVLSFLSGATHKVGFYGFNHEGLYRGNFLTHKVNYNCYQHMGLNFLSLVESISSLPSPYPTVKQILNKGMLELPRVRISDEQVSLMYEKIGRINQQITEFKQIILINPSGGLLSIRAWPEEYYVELCKRILMRSNYCIIVIGTVADCKLTGSIVELVKSKFCVNFAGETSNIKELLALFKIAKAIVTSDSGCAHIASTTDIHNIVIFGPETPILYAPLSPSTKFFYKNIHCSPCLSAFNHRQTPCDGDNQCVKMISVDEVEKALFSDFQ